LVLWAQNKQHLELEHQRSTEGAPDGEAIKETAAGG